jgi:cytochrome c1
VGYGQRTRRGQLHVQSYDWDGYCEFYATKIVQGDHQRTRVHTAIVQCRRQQWIIHCRRERIPTANKRTHPGFHRASGSSVPSACSFAVRSTTQNGKQEHHRSCTICHSVQYERDLAKQEPYDWVQEPVNVDQEDSIVHVKRNPQTIDEHDLAEKPGNREQHCQEQTHCCLVT